MRIDELLDAGHDLIRLADHPRASSTIQRAAAAGHIVGVLPGIYARSGREAATPIRLRAACLWVPGGCLHGVTALQLWRRQPISYPLHLKGRWKQVRVPWLRLTKGDVSDFVAGDRVRVATRLDACVELAGSDSGEAIFDGLRAGWFSAEHLEPALRHFAGTRGNQERTRVVLAASSNPWSFAEAKLHQLLRAAGIAGWVANPPIRVGGRLVAPDLLLASARLVIEFDGEAAHSGHEQFEADRRRRNLLVCHGYRVIRVTWTMLTRDPDYVVATVRAALRAL